MIFLKNRGQGRNFKNSDTVSCRYGTRRVCLFTELRAEVCRKTRNRRGKIFPCRLLRCRNSYRFVFNRIYGTHGVFRIRAGLYHTFCISPDCTVYPLVVYELPSRV